MDVKRENCTVCNRRLVFISTNAHGHAQTVFQTAVNISTAASYHYLRYVVILDMLPRGRPTCGIDHRSPSTHSALDPFQVIYDRIDYSGPPKPPSWCIKYSSSYAVKFASAVITHNPSVFKRSSPMKTP